MFIQTELTPNPEVIKFIPGRQVLPTPGAKIEFNNPEQAQHNQLAAMIFQNNGIINVFLTNDYISITKDNTADWDIIKPLSLGTIIEYYTLVDRNMHDPMGATQTEQAQNDALNTCVNFDTLSDIEKEIYELLETRIRPAIAGDGGDITFEKFLDGIVYVRLRGACSGCPSSTVTLKDGIENLLKHYVPEIKEVKSI